jgi:CO/xanthine dehydrogenase Mo-binding subunit
LPGQKIAAHLLGRGNRHQFKTASSPLPAGSQWAFCGNRWPPTCRTTIRSWAQPGLEETAFYDPTNFTFPAGTHICEVEVDPETGVVQVVNFSACDDFGNIINPMIVEGQVHGGVAQGIGQALLENCVYDPESGQLLTGSYMDYALPRAHDLPSFKVGTKVTPCTHNPLGAKGCGGAGAIGAPAAVMNAVHEALAAVGVTRIDMPASPSRLAGYPGGARLTHVGGTTICMRSNCAKRNRSPKRHRYLRKPRASRWQAVRL